MAGVLKLAARPVDHGAVTEIGGLVDVAVTLRALRRQADLSQRELAERAGVPRSTLARIETGQGSEPGFRTVERLIRAAGGELAIGGPTHAPLSAVPGVPHEGRRDEGGRRYPPHLDVREVRRLTDWPGAWWAHWYTLPPERWPLRVPEVTYDRDRRRRDERRWRERVRRQVRVRRVTDELPESSWCFLAELPGDAVVGELRAHERSEDLLLGDDLGDQREMILDGVVVAPELRLLGIGRRLVARLSEEMGRAGIRTARAFAQFGDVRFLLACGFQLEASRPEALRLDRRDPEEGPDTGAGRERPGSAEGGGGLGQGDEGLA
ncbi:GNAT family N-acetyltransferase [Micromonospora sp. NPDC094482]|uniref:GNAT family N-acetyltransferase n=1 Tax=Micromonospora sp. NPDC094482 TaxID=3155081 RepID=UPI0033290299